MLPDSGNASLTPPNRSNTPNPPPPPGGTFGSPLPQHVDEVDIHATQVTPAAYTPPQYPSRPRPQAPLIRPPVPPTRASSGYGTQPPVSTPRKTQVNGRHGHNPMGCFRRGLVIMLFTGTFLLILAASLLVVQYVRIASGLPSIEDLQKHTSQFETTRILDRSGNLLYEVIDPTGGRRTYVKLDQISPFLIATTLATEDKEYYNHPGFDPLAIARALWANYTTGEVISGASTITQQLARILLLSPEERNQVTIQRKAREIVLSAEITRRYSKEQILEMYLNEINYGNLSYGIEAAAETYFQTTATKLSYSQAAFLAGLPQAPGVYDIFTHRDQTLNRHKDVLVLTYRLSQERNCIVVRMDGSKVCVNAVETANAVTEMENYKFKAALNNMRFPHWVNYIRSELEGMFDAQTIYRSGFTVYTTIDPDLQQRAEEIVKQQVDTLGDRHVSDGALIAIRPSTGEVLAMVGSADFKNVEIAGQINMALAPRQPGSSIKPITYTAAFEKGWTPATLIWDIPTDFPPSGDPNDQRDPYKPVNYDGRFHGPVTVRTALANSFNIPAVKTLNFVGIYDNPATPAEDGFLALARRMGITTLTRNDYGLSLTLGGGDVNLLELTRAFSIFANSGVKVPTVSITKIVDFTGKVVYKTKASGGEQVIRPEYAFLISSILSDNEARTPMFGANSVLNLPFQVAVKTGTTNDFRDNWTLGYTPDLAVGVWVGNADYTPMEHTTGVTGAAPIWAQFMQEAINRLTGNSPTPFNKPAQVIEKIICTISGAEPSDSCPAQRREYFAYNQPPLPKEQDLWQKVNIDTWTGLKASPSCSEFTEEKNVVNVTDPGAIKWLKESDDGRAWAKDNGFGDEIIFAPDRECKAEDPHVSIHFAGLNDGQVIKSSPLDIYVVITATDKFKDFELDYGKGDKPSSWKVLKGGMDQQYKLPEMIYTWDLSALKPGGYTLRVIAHSTDGGKAEKHLHLNIQVPTPTPTNTSTPTNTATPTLTPTITNTAVPPTVTLTPIPIPPSATPIP